MSECLKKIEEPNAHKLSTEVLIMAAQQAPNIKVVEARVSCCTAPRDL